MPATLQEIVAAVTSGRDGFAALEYKKGSHATGEGDRYEERMLALVFLRCLRRGLLFQLSANNDDAGKFDDVVVMWRPKGHSEAHTLLVQLKHKTSSKSMTLLSKEWLSKDPNGQFSLSKYCSSYRKISESLKMERVAYVLLTNAHLAKNSLNLFVRPDVDRVPGLELVQAGGELYRLNWGNQKVREAVCENASFVEHFYLLCNQRNSVEIVNDICEELEMLLGAGDVCRSILDQLCFRVREWMNMPQGVCLTSGWNEWQAIVDEYVRKEVTACKVVTTRLKYCSVADVQYYVDSRNPAWVRPPESGTQALSATKIHQVLAKETHIMVPLERFSKQRHQILRCWGPFCRWLVIVDEDREHNSDILDQLLSETQSERRLVIVSSRENNGFVDTCQSSDISDDSWNECLDVKVRLNGDHYKCRLRDLVASVDALKSLLDGQPALLLALAQLSEPLRMGQELEPLPAYYMPRRLVNWRLLTDEFFSSLGRWDVCVTDSTSYGPLQRVVGKHTVMSLEKMKIWLLTASQVEWPLFVLTDDLETIQEVVKTWAGLNIFILQVCNDRWKILNLFGFADRIPGYAIQHEKEQLEELDTSSNVIIVEGRPGVGKSKMLSHVAKKIKERDSAVWLLRVNLLKFYTVLEDSASGVSAAEDILKATLFNKGGLGRLEFALLRHSLLQSPRVVCLVDGFDEVCPDYVNKCLDVLPVLSPRLGKLLVTTRPEPVKLLEARLGVLAQSLEPFSDLELQDFLTHHPSRRNVPPISRVHWSKRDLLRIPLFAEMFANVSQEIAETYDIVTLYEAFFQNKFTRLYKEKWGDNLSVPGKKKEVMDAQKRHEEQLMLLAASVLLRTTEIPAKPSFDSDYFVKAGIVYKFTDGKPAFLHRTFAEHFLAKWCFLSDGEGSRAAVYREAYRNETLEFFLESFDRMAVRGRPVLEAVLEALLAGSEGEVGALLAEGRDPAQTDACGRNALHLAAAYGPRRSLPLLRRLCTHEGVGALTSEDGLLGWTPMRYAVASGRWLNVEELVEAGGDLSHLVAFLPVRHDPTELQAVFERGGYRALYRHVFEANHPLLQTPNHSLWEDKSPTPQIEFTVSLMSANVERESLKCIAEKAGEEGHSIVRTLLSCICYRKEQEEMIRQKEEAILKAKYYRPKRWRNLQMGGWPQSAPAGGTQQRESSSCGPSYATEFLDGASGAEASCTADDRGSGGPEFQLVGNHKFGRYAFVHHCAETGKSRILRALIQSGRDLDVRDEHGATALHCAAFSGDVECVSLLVEAGADVSAKCDDGSTPLHWAAGRGHVDCVRLLLEGGADVDDRNLRNYTPLTCALKAGSAECVRLLEAAAADRQSRRSNSPLLSDGTTGWF